MIKNKSIVFLFFFTIMNNAKLVDMNVAASESNTSFNTLHYFMLFKTLKDNLHGTTVQIEKPIEAMWL